MSTTADDTGIESPATTAALERDRPRWRTAELATAVAVSLAIGAGAGTVLVPARGVRAVEPNLGRAASIERSDRIPREELIVSAVAAAHREGCSVVLRTGRATRAEGWGFRRATRMMAHELMARRGLDRVTSKVVRTEEGVAGVVYGERCT